MAYTLNSARDASGNEQQFVEKFRANQAAIVRYKQQHGGALEDAYQAVTGEPWPQGRSVKITNGQPEMTKDRTVKSVLGKYVAPAAAAAIAPFALPALMGGASTAALGPVAAAGGTTAATVPAALAPALTASWTAPAMAGLAPGAVSSLAGGAAPALAGAAAPAVAGGAARTGLSWGNALKYGAPMVGGAVNDIMQNRQATAAREQQQQQSDRNLALQESVLDPFRGVMHQTADVSELERLANGPRVYRPSMASPYARYYNPANEPPPLSATASNSYRNAQGMVASGQGTVPTMLDQENWGQTGTYDLTQPGVSPASRVARARPSRLRRG